MGERSIAGSITEWTAVMAGATTTVAMIATPLLPQGGRGRRLLSSVVVTGAFVTTTANAARRWGWRRASIAAAATAVATGVVERVGTRTGWPFGRYAYTDSLRPHVAGVPVIVPLAWFALGLPARETAHSALGPTAPRAARIALGAAALTAWDVFLDPQMVGEGYWRWARRGAYRGIPLSNFAGWFVTAVGVMGLLDALLDRPANPSLDPTRNPPRDLPLSPPRNPPRDPSGGRPPDPLAKTPTDPSRNRPRDPSASPPPDLSHNPLLDPSVDDRAARAPDAALVGEYGFMAVMETLGFAAFFRDRLVAAVGGAAMLPIAIAGIAGLRRG